MKKYSIAIDGPAGAGKSTIAKMIAKDLDYIYVDTGAMYRAYGLYCINKELEDIEEYEEILKDVDIDIKFIDKVQRIFLNDVDVTEKIRAEEIGNMASRISTKKAIRDHLVQMQREIAENNNVVMDGRDIGSNVLKDATIKIYLTASEDVRAERRWKELQEKGVDKDYSIIKEEIVKRDYQDMNRDYAPLIQAEDAVLVDTSCLTIDEAKEAIIKLFQDKKSQIV